MRSKSDKMNMQETAGEDMPIGSFTQMSIDMSKRRFTRPDLSKLALLPTRNLVLFPGVNLSLGLGREVSIKIAEEAERNNTPVGIVCQVEAENDAPSRLKDLYNHGVIAYVIKVLELPNGEKTVLLAAQNAFTLTKVMPSETIPGALTGVVRSMRVTQPHGQEKELEYQVLLENIRDIAKTILKHVFGEHLPFDPEAIQNPDEVINTIATNIPFPIEEKARMLGTGRMLERARMLSLALGHYKTRMDLNAEIERRTRENLDQNQRNVFLQQQMETIREELYGSDDDDVAAFENRADQLPDTVAAAVKKEIDKLARLNPQSPDYSVLYTYIDTVLSLPWNKQDDTNPDIKSAEARLEADHYGLEKVKERIVEQLAMILDNPKGRAPILCLVGPPGVGKTSLGASVAAALGRQYQRVALGGLHDEAEIRGHRRTYIGAMPGRIIEAIRRAGTSNPVLLLDEIDKIGADYKGDPAAALLEVLDPEQNCHFHDNYIDIDFDLSNCLFIATANTLQTVSRPLLDRIEVIELPGYLVEEKVEIAKRHLLPRLLKQQGWAPDSITVSDEVLTAIIEDYTSESGVRQLEKALATVLRKAVLAKQRGVEFIANITDRGCLRDLLGIAPFRRDRCPQTAVPGVVTGLAWTQVGGEILLAEVSLSPAKSAGKLTLTGNLGDVMKESAEIALQWVKAHAESLGIDSERFEKNNVHVHFPEGAIPKDGPSAGITIATAIVSAFLGRPTRLRLAMTGEITLRGQVLPVGGIREKILAAHRSGVTDVILSSDNRRDIEDIPPRYIDGLNVHYVETVADVLDAALQPE